MIQRIQSVWLLLASVAGFVSLRLPFYSGNMENDLVKTYTSLNATTNMILLVLTVAVAVSSFLLIFLFQNRKLQMRLTVATMLVSFVNIYLFFKEVGKFVEGSFNISAVIVFVIPIFLFLAAKGIYADQKLVKSLDRLR